MNASVRGPGNNMVIEYNLRGRFQQEGIDDRHAFFNLASLVAHAKSDPSVPSRFLDDFQRLVVVFSNEDRPLGAYPDAFRRALRSNGLDLFSNVGEGGYRLQDASKQIEAA